MEPARRMSWQSHPMPAEREMLNYAPFFDDVEAEQLRLGLLPREMEDKWFVFFEEGWLYFHRSWTGHCIFSMRLDGSPAGVRTLEVWVNRNKDQYNSAGSESDIKLLERLISNQLLRRG
ncbi:MAG: hypothetical protein C0485_00645 [Pirellula sp.]|nr:hypothetical protein [Pirellula sp.]